MPNKPGTRPNTSIVLTADELAFIAHKFNGKKSAAIHAGLRLLMQSGDYDERSDGSGSKRMPLSPG